MSSTNEVRVSLVRESSIGTTPSNPVFREIPFTSAQSFGAIPKTVTSDAITGDRQVLDLTVVSTAASANIGSDLVMLTMDEIQESAFMNSWSNKPTIINLVADTQISGVVSADSQFTFPSGGGVFSVGDIIQTSGFTNSGNNGVFLVSGSAAGYVEVTELDGTAVVLVNESAPPRDAMVKVVGVKAGADDVDATSSGLTSTVLDFTTLGLVVGERVKIGGSATGTKFTTAANNGFARVSAISAHTLTFDVLPSGWSAEESSGSIELEIYLGDVLRNGSTILTFTGEQAYTDHSPVSYNYMTGMGINQFQISFKPEAIATCTMDFMGLAASATTTAISGSTYIAPVYTYALNSSSNVGELSVNDSSVTAPNYIVGVDLSINNNMRQTIPIGSSFAQATNLGDCEVTGTLSTYFGDLSQYQRILNGTEVPVSLKLQDGYNHVYIYEMPRIQFTEGSPAVSGKNADVTLDAKFQALKHATLGYTIQLQRFFYIP